MEYFHSTWNIFIPHGVHMEYGGRVKYCHTEAAELTENDVILPYLGCVPDYIVS
jgi:hypothetical protein